jgi:ribosome-associated protein YbcJ (S4-like RNA binding protein)
MSEPKITLQQILKQVAEKPTSPEFELALVEFLELSDSEQKAILFRGLVDTGGQINWILAELRK